MYAGALAVVAVAYYLSGRIGLELAYLDGAVAALWPPAGLGLAILVLFGVRLWPGIVIGDLLLADFSTPLGTVLAQTVGNTVALVVAALLLRRLTGGRCSLERVTDVLAFVGCALVAALVSAAFGPLALRLGDVIPPDELGRVFRTWTLGDAAGVLVVAPVILTWASSGLRGFGRRELAEGAVVLVLLVALATLPPQRDVPYIVFPVLLWAAVRFGPRGAASAVFVACCDHRLDHGAERRPVRARLDHGQPARDAALHRHLGAHVARARGGDRRAHAGRGGAHGERGVPARARRRAGGAAPGRHARRQRGAAEPRVRAGDQGGRAAPGRARGERRALRRPRHGDGRRGLERRRQAAACPSASTIDLDGDTVVAKVLRTDRPQRAEYEDAGGTLADKLQSAGYRAAVAAPVNVAGHLWGALAAGTRSADPFPEGAEGRLCDFAELVAQALANADAHEQLAASRARLVEAGDAERRRLERNLHDGAQQRLVSVALNLRVVEANLEKDPPAAGELLSAAREELAQGSTISASWPAASIRRC